MRDLAALRQKKTPGWSLRAFSSKNFLSHEAQQVPSSGGKAGEDDAGVGSGQLAVHCFAKDSAEVSCNLQVAALIEVAVIQARPLAVNSAALDLTAEHEHHVGVSVVSAASAVLAGGASKLRHRDQH